MGELVECEGYSHLVKANDIITRMGWQNFNLIADQILYDLGWMRISRKTYGDCGLVFFTPAILSAEQRRYLEMIAEDDSVELSKEGKQTLKELALM